MKKLLALVLCVVMVLSFSATAFAAGTTGGIAWPYDEDREPSYISKAAANKTIADLGKDMKAMYYAIAADETVFGAAKGIYSMTDSLAKELLKDTEKMTLLDGTVIYNEDLVSNVRKGLNHIIGNEIANYMNERFDVYTDSDGFVQPEKYLNTFVKALNSTLGSAKAQKNIEAFVYGLATLSLQKSVNDRADDLYQDIIDWDHWKEFYWTQDEEGNPLNVHDPKDAYATTWLPTLAETDTVLVPTGSWDAFGDSWLAYAAAAGYLK